MTPGETRCGNTEFDTMADYDGLVRLDLGAYGLEQRRDIRSIRRYLPDGAKMLDVGCGVGLPSRDLARYFDVEACDIPSWNGRPTEFVEMVMKLRKIPFRWSKPFELPYEDGTFDGVMLYAVLEHVKEKTRFLNEVRRVLKPGGKIFAFRMVNRLSFAEKLADLLGVVNHGEEVVTRKMLRDALEESGFRCLAMERQGWLPENGLPKWIIYPLNKLLCRIPGIACFCHDFRFVAEIRGAPPLTSSGTGTPDAQTPRT